MPGVRTRGFLFFFAGILARATFVPGDFARAFVLIFPILFATSLFVVFLFTLLRSRQRSDIFSGLRLAIQFNNRLPRFIGQTIVGIMPEKFLENRTRRAGIVQVVFVDFTNRE